MIDSGIVYSTATFIWSYLVLVFWLTGEQIILVFAPVLVASIAMYPVTCFMHRQAQTIFGYPTYAYATSIGIVIHEVGHAIFCLIFFHKIRKINLFSLNEHEVEGFVEHSFNRKNIFHQIGNFFIGTGPIWLGSFLIVTTSEWLLPTSLLDIAPEIEQTQVSLASIEGLQIYTQSLLSVLGAWMAAINQQGALFSIRFWFWLYLVYCIGNHITLSKPDLHIARSGFFFLFLSLVIINFISVLWVGEIAQNIAQQLSWFTSVIVIVMAATILINLTLFIVIRLTIGFIRGY